jgi:hypothetical protein
MLATSTERGNREKKEGHHARKDTKTCRFVTQTASLDAAKKRTILHSKSILGSSPKCNTASNKTRTNPTLADLGKEPVGSTLAILHSEKQFA